MNNRATLSYVLKDKNNLVKDSVNLEYSSLYDIDNYTRSFSGDDEIIGKDSYFGKINDLLNKHKMDDLVGSICVYYVKDENNRIEFKPLYKNVPNIHLRAYNLDDTNTEVEKTRKLLFKSKNRLFTIMFLSNREFIPTISTDIKLTKEESWEAKKQGLRVRYEEDNYYLSIKEIMEYSLKVDRLGNMRPLFEDSLEIWKENMDDLNDDDLYYYSRILNDMIRDYNQKKMKDKVISNLKASSKVFLKHRNSNFRVNTSDYKHKVKVLEII